VPRAPGDSAPAYPIEQDDAPPMPGLEGRGSAVRIALAREVQRVTLSGTGEWRIYDSGGGSTLLRAPRGALWTIESRRGQLRAVDEEGRASAERAAPFMARTASRGSYIAVNGKRYRGEVWVFPVGQGVTVVNRVSVEDYLRGVVPLEIGRRGAGEEAAVAAQAVAARSYAYTHLTSDPSRMFDMVATVMDQVYGGVDAETPMSDAAVAATAGLVLKYRGVVVNAPYHSTCGGTTAGASEVWRSRDEPYLVPVSDRIPGTADRYYCDASPRFRWTRTFTSAQFRAALDRYLRQYASVPARTGIGRPESVAIDARTPTGRARTLVIRTDNGRYSLRGNDIRFVLREPGGEILNSTYFSVETERAGGRGALTRVVVRGTGYGHGIGMCQWGAIGRARAGQDFRTILRTYYPGTTVAAMMAD
jgi:stage II sporulation protein D